LEPNQPLSPATPSSAVSDSIRSRPTSSGS
jgi:hypothetical protein